MPVTPWQHELLRLLAANRSGDSYVAGSVPLLRAPESQRFTSDVDVFHDSESRLASAFAADTALLRAHGYSVVAHVTQPAFTRAEVSNAFGNTQVDWSRDSAWRFLPAKRDDEYGYALEPVDIAVNKVLALAGREEPRDLLDVLEIHRTLLPLAALCWAASGKDPGFSPRSILERLKRKGRYHAEDFGRLELVQPVVLTDLKSRWLAALDQAERELDSPPRNEAGCLYYSPSAQRFVWPVPDRGDAVPHYGRPGGILPVAVAQPQP